MKYIFYKPCDRFRLEPDGERRWQEMIENRQRISLSHFLLGCDPSGLLDEGETFSNWWAATVGDPQRGIYMSHWTETGEVVVYFIQTAGFEFIFIHP